MLAAALLVPSLRCAYAQGANKLDCAIEPNIVTKISSPVEGLEEAVPVEKSDLAEAG